MRFMMLMIPKGYEKAEPGTMGAGDTVSLCPKEPETKGDP